MLGLAAQYLTYNRDNFVKNPSQASMLNTLCVDLHLSCQLANADAAAIGVQVNKLDANADKTDAVITLTNQSKLVQLYPTLKLTLLANNVPVGQLIATPMQYLDTPNLHMSGEQIRPIKLRIDMPRNKFDRITVDKLY